MKSQVWWHVAVISVMLRWETEVKGTLEAQSLGTPCYIAKFPANERETLSQIKAGQCLRTDTQGDALTSARAQ